jgi:serine/threonine-protein kinase
MGAVFRGVDLMLEREVAIKMLRPELAVQPQVVERFRSEAITLAKLNHPNIATLYSFIRQGEDYFMVMEHVRGETLDEAIKKFGALPVERAVPLFCRALEGIDHAHKMGIIHRDIKPGNIMLTETGSIKVMDFGIARVLGTARMTRQGSVVGTVEYMSPEQVRGLESDARSDVYSLGILLYEMLTGRVPFNSDSEFNLMKAQIEEAPAPPRKFAAQISLAVEQAIMRALAKKPEARYQTAGEFRAALLSAMGAVTTPLSPQPVNYVAPVTRLMDAATSPSISEKAPKEDVADTVAAKQTRLAGSPAARSSAAFTEQAQETVALSNESNTLRANLVAQEVATPNQPGQRRAQASRLNWKHYAAAAVALLVLIGIPLALVKLRAASPAPAADTASPQSTDATDAPPASPGQTATPAPNQAGAETGSSEGAAPPNDSADNANSASDLAKPARARGSRNENAAETPAPDVTVPAQPVTAAPPAVTTPPPPQQQPAAPPDDKSAVVTEANKNVAKKEEKKSGGIGGFFKRVFGGGDKKKTDNKNRS